MKISKEILTNVPAANNKGQAPINQFAHIVTFPGVEFRRIVRPHVDTLYSSAWLDLKKAPIVLSVPDTQGRYYFMSMLDAWTHVFATIGKRTSGTNANNYAIIGPHWRGILPIGMKAIRAPTNTVWLIGQMQMDSTEDSARIQQLQAQFKLTPLNYWNNAYTPPDDASIDEGLDKTSPIKQVANMDALTYFRVFAEGLKQNPPHAEDQVIVAELQEIGLVPGKEFAGSKLSLRQIQALDRAVKDAQTEIVMAAKKTQHVVNGWNVMQNNVGNYGKDYLTRAAMAYAFLGANLPHDVLFPTAYSASDGSKLNGRNHYRLHFKKNQLPPVQAFWSLTINSGDNAVEENYLHRHALGSRDHLQFNRDGSLDIYIQHASPGKNKESNWLPAPYQDFSITLRMYWPAPSALLGKWIPPTILKEDK